MTLPEGCQDKLRAHLDTALEIARLGAVDPSAHTREAACFCYGQLSEHCQPEVLSKHATVLPALCATKDDAPPRSPVSIACPNPPNTHPL